MQLCAEGASFAALRFMGLVRTGTWDGQVLPDEIRATVKPAKKVLAVIQAALLFTEHRDAVRRVIWPMQCAQSG